MTYQHRPEYEAPPHLRCEAIVAGRPTYTFEWMRHDHQCPRKANQGRDGRLVCWQHAAAKRVNYISTKEQV